MDKIELNMLVLAALLHDVGKFAQRAGAGKSEDTVGYCPTDPGSKRPSHLHVLYTDYFIEKILPLPLELDSDRLRSRLARLASAHHKPAGDDLYEKAISVADGLSAGTDRKQGEAAEGDYKSARLLSIFEQISLDEPRTLEALQTGRCHVLAPLSDNPFPAPLAEARKSDYATLYDAFVAGLKDLPLDMGVTHYVASLQALLEEYTWCIPSSTYKSLADISLYDHAATTAAIAQALVVYHQTTAGSPGQGSGEKQKFVLVGGDLSGIQRYIFGIDKSHGSGVAKLFRARSFYLQLLTRSVVVELLERLNLTATARVMDAGGRFILLLPATEAVLSLLPEFDLEVQRYFFERFRGELCLNLCWSVALTEEDFRLDRFQRRLDEFNDALEDRKLRKFDRLLAQGVSPVIDLDYSAYDKGDCPVCHARPVDSAASAKHRSHYGVAVDVCCDCAEQIEMIGSRLHRSDYLVLNRVAKDGVALFGGLSLHLSKSISAEKERSAVEIISMRRRGRFAYLPIATNLPSIDAQDMAAWRGWGEIEQREDNWWLKDEKIVVGEPKTFSLMARSAREMDPQGKPVGRSFLGAFKADVDNLGIIFSVGLQDRLSISRFASLSRMLNHFFSDDLVRWIKSQKEFADLYVVFAGGDDLFLLGPWRQIIRFGVALNKRFCRYVAERTDVTLSAGIAVTKPMLPVHAIAEQAEENLDAAKKQPGKNAICLFDTCVGWNQFSELIDKGDWLHRLLREQKVPKGLAARLLYYGDERRAFAAGEIARGIYLSHMRYDFARNINAKTIPDAGERADILALQHDGDLLQNIRLPVTWALYRQRKES